MKATPHCTDLIKVFRLLISVAQVFQSSSSSFSPSQHVFQLPSAPLHSSPSSSPPTACKYARNTRPFYRRRMWSSEHHQSNRQPPRGHLPRHPRRIRHRRRNTTTLHHRQCHIDPISRQILCKPRHLRHQVRPGKLLF